MPERFTTSRPSDGVTLLQMSRPEKLNAMDRVWFAELASLMAGLGRDDGVRAIVLTGSGRAFSAGGDIDMFHDLAGDVRAVRPHLQNVYDAFHAVERCPVPVIAAVNGLAFGGGTELALACDLVLAGASARFAFKEVTVGLSPGYGIVRGPQVIGRQWTRFLALTGREIGPDQAVRIGLALQSLPDDELLTAALQLATDVAAQPPLAVQVGKAFINRDTHQGFDESVDSIALLFGTAEHREAVRSFRQARGR